MIESLLYVLSSEPSKIGATIGAALLIGGTLRLMNYSLSNIFTWLIVGAVYAVLQFWLKAALGVYISSEQAEAATFVSASSYFVGLLIGNSIVSRYSRTDIGKPLREIAPEVARKELNRSGKENLR